MSESKAWGAYFIRLVVREGLSEVVMIKLRPEREKGASQLCGRSLRSRASSENPPRLLNLNMFIPKY